MFRNSVARVVTLAVFAGLSLNQIASAKDAGFPSEGSGTLVVYRDRDGAIHAKQCDVGGGEDRDCTGTEISSAPEKKFFDALAKVSGTAGYSVADGGMKRAVETLARLSADAADESLQDSERNAAEAKIKPLNAVLAKLKRISAVHGKLDAGQTLTLESYRAEAIWFRAAAEAAKPAPEWSCTECYKWYPNYPNGGGATYHTYYVKHKGQSDHRGRDFSDEESCAEARSRDSACR